MKVVLLVIGKTDESYLKEALAVYEKRLGRYLSFEMKELPTPKGNTSPTEQKRKEASLILTHPDVNSADFIVLLDEKGTEMTSPEFSIFVQKQFNKGIKKMVFLTGGAYGFAEGVYEKGNAKIALSKLTFSHQMVRVFFIEQLYRAMTILKGEKYHH